MQVIKRDTPTVYDFTGFVEAQQKVTVMSRVSGRITGKNFNGGDYVTAGQVLFTIDSRTAKGGCFKCRSQPGQRQVGNDRVCNATNNAIRSLYAQSAVSKQVYDQAVAAAEQARAAVTR
jgi:membrane fusion protein (multidrug efflux system)